MDRLLQEAKDEGEIDTLVARMTRKARKEALLATDKDELVHMCDELDVDPLAKEVMIERLLNYESEFGVVVLAKKNSAKKARTSK